MSIITFIHLSLADISGFSLLATLCFNVKWACAWQSQQKDLCAERRLRDQLGHPPSLIAVCMKKSSVLSYPISAQWKLWFRLDGCPGWSESSLGAYVILLCAGSNHMVWKMTWIYKCIREFITKAWWKWAASWQNQQYCMCAQRRLRSAWASAQSDQSLHCPHEDCFGP